MIRTLHRWKQSGKQVLASAREVLVAVCANLGQVGI